MSGGSILRLPSSPLTLPYGPRDVATYSDCVRFAFADPRNLGRTMNHSEVPVPVSLVTLIEAQQAILGLTNEDLCTALGFERRIALTLIKSGSMKMPLNKIPRLAATLKLDPVELLKTAMSETSPDLLQVIDEVLNPLRVTATETNLIRQLRELAGDQQLDPIVFGGKGVIALVAV